MDERENGDRQERERETEMARICLGENTTPISFFVLSLISVAILYIISPEEEKKRDAQKLRTHIFGFLSNSAVSFFNLFLRSPLPPPKGHLSPFLDLKVIQFISLSSSRRRGGEEKGFPGQAP